MKRALSSVWLFTACLSLNSPANAIGDVGWIEVIIGPPSAVMLQRGPDRLPVTQYQTLHEGDVLSVHGDARLEIRLGEGSKNIVVLASNSPFAISRVGEVPRVWSKMLGWLHEVALRKVGKGQPDGERLAIAATRSSAVMPEPLGFPMFPLAEYSLLAGQRDLHFVWQGGVAPYSIRLNNKLTGELVAQQIGVADKEALLKAAVIVPGTYMLRVTDAHGASRLQRLSAVESKAGPKRADNLDTKGLSATQHAFLEAARLAGQSDQAWLFEAYQQLFEIDLPEAVFLRDVISQGRALPVVGP